MLVTISAMANVLGAVCQKFRKSLPLLVYHPPPSQKRLLQTLLSSALSSPDPLRFVQEACPVLLCGDCVWSLIKACANACIIFRHLRGCMRARPSGATSRGYRGLACHQKCHNVSEVRHHYSVARDPLIPTSGLTNHS